MNFKIHILLLSSLLVSDAYANASDTNNYIAALTQLLEQKTIGDEELITVLEAAESGKIVNPISPIRAETSVEHFVANEALKELLEGKIDGSKVADWAKANIKQQERIRKKRDQARNATILEWKEDPSVLSVHKETACAVTIDGTARCWGVRYINSPSEGVFRSVSAGRDHACGIQLNGTVICWGWNGYGQVDAPRGVFKSVSATAARTYGLKDDGSVECWGSSSRFYTPAGIFRSFSADSTGDSYCGIRMDDSVECLSPFFRATPPGKFRSVSVGHMHACGIGFDGGIRCWGENSNGRCNAPTGVFQSVAAGNSHTCGLRTDGTMECWGSDGEYHPAPSARSGKFYAMSSRVESICAVRLNGSVECWGGKYDLSPPCSRLVPTGQATETSTNISIINSFIRRLLAWSGLS